MLARNSLIVVLLLLLAGCATHPAAPVIERAPAAQKTVKHKKGPADWRPATHTVKRGETLYSIALEYGLDYRELASWNQIDNSFVIKVGQVLRLKPQDGGVVVTPLAKTPVVVSAAPSDQLVQEPKAVKLPYSDQALANLQSPAKPVQPVVPVKPAEKVAEQAAQPVQPAAAASDDAADDASDEDHVDWVWPTKGKILNGFNDKNGTKGIDIGGESGQAVIAAGAGKVVYSGSGLRGYGKLIIIKHNKTYLSAYAHNRTLLVKEGDMVAQGQKIAEMGDSDADKVALHFEIRRFGKPVDPVKYLPGSK